MSIIDNTKSVKRAAELIGVTDRTLRGWITNFFERCPTGRGKPGRNECRAIKKEEDIFPAGYAYFVPDDEIERLKSAPQTGGGRPRLGKAS